MSCEDRPNERTDNCEMMEKRKLISRLVRPTPPSSSFLVSCCCCCCCCPCWTEFKMYLQPFECVDGGGGGGVKRRRVGKNQHYVQEKCRPAASSWVDRAIRQMKMVSRWWWCVVCWGPMMSVAKKRGENSIEFKLKNFPFTRRRCRHRRRPPPTRPLSSHRPAAAIDDGGMVVVGGQVYCLQNLGESSRHHSWTKRKRKKNGRKV